MNFFEESVYASNHGLLAEVGTGPIPLSAQGEVIEHILNSSPEVRRLVGTSTTDFIEACAGSSHLRERVRDSLADLGYVADDGFNSRDSIDISYGSAESGLKAPVGDDWLTVRGSPDDLDRRGEPCVVVATSLAGTLGGHALVIPGGSEEPGLVARVVHQSDIPRGVVLADQAVRNATGVEVGEYIRLRPASIATSRIADMLVASRRYITARVQGADLAIVEQASCLMDRLAMQMIGIESGDVVVIEGVSSEAATPVPSIRIKAYECDEAIQDRRERLQGGGFESRFPSSRDALSVYPDLPWVYLDRAARTTLGLSDQKLGAVRIRASRRNQVGKEAREIVLLVTLAVIGIIAVSESPLIRGLFVMALVVAIIAVLILRLRYRLGLAKVRILGRPRR